MDEIYSARMSVREFVEFVCRSGDLDTRSGRVDPQAMREGQKIHQEIQNSQPEQYVPEVSLSGGGVYLYEDEPYEIGLSGRADGIITLESPVQKLGFQNTELALFESAVFIDEIKSMYTNIEHYKEPEPVHLAQAKCYAFFVCEKDDLASVGVQITYCNIDNLNIRYFTYEFSRNELKEWFDGLALYYAKWMHWEKHHIKSRDESIKKLQFPFEYRKGQKELVKNVYLTLLREKKIFIEAPTGVGKTISTVFPGVKAIGEGLASKLFYTTARTITRTVAEETAGIIKEHGTDLLAVTLTAKDKICIFEKSECNPEKCERAKGHEDRVNEAVFDLISHEKAINRQVIEEYAKKHCVCPFEMALDVSLWCDMIICDYNYCFDPDVYLRRFFHEGNVGRFLLFVDEAHNLVDRAREMYSASLSTKRIRDVRPKVKEREEIRKAFTKVSNAISKAAKEAEGKAGAPGETETDGESVAGAVGRSFKANAAVKGLKSDKRYLLTKDDCTKIFSACEKLMTRLKTYVLNRKVTPDEDVLDFFFELRTFEMTVARLDENYTITLDRRGADCLLSLNCMNPSARLSDYMNFYRGKAFFSATLLPVKYYMEQLTGTEEDYAVYAPSPFDRDKRLVLAARDVSAKYTRRNKAEYQKIMQYIDVLVHSKTGNYLVFFPSYKVMEDIYEVLLEDYGGFAENFDFRLIKQRMDMDESEREEFLAAFEHEPETSLVGFCVMGGIFSEGIDLRADRLIGVAIVGTGLPMVGDERELFRNYYDSVSGNGFEHAYLWPGMNKVLQAGGRVIRTEEDRGVILLLDDRFLTRTYNSLFPEEWQGYRVTDMESVESEIKKFWGI